MVEKVTKADLLQRIEELQRKINELEKRPSVQYHYHPKTTWDYPYPSWKPQVWCKTTSINTLPAVYGSDKAPI